MLSTRLPITHDTAVGAFLIALLSCLTLPLGAQIVGGGLDTHYTFHGETAGNGLGFSVAGAGDVNQDGFDDLIVGAFAADPGGEVGAGSAYVYSGQDGMLLWQFDGSAGDHLGWSVEGAGDVNQDGFDDVIVGAFGASPGGLGSAGSAFVHGYNPFLIPSAVEVSAVSGGLIAYALDFPDGVASSDYVIMLSASGTGPFRFAIDVPLTLDFLVVHTFFFDLGPPFLQIGFRGALDSNGDALAIIGFPPGVLVSLIGFEFHLAAVSLRPGVLPEWSSVSVPLKIVL